MQEQLNKNQESYARGKLLEHTTFTVCDKCHLALGCRQRCAKFWIEFRKNTENPALVKQMRELYKEVDLVCRE